MKKVFLISAFMLCFLGLVFPEQEKKISFDFRDAPLEDVFRTIAKQSGYNIIVSKEVIAAGKITISAHDVLPDDAIRQIASANGFIAIHKKNIFKIIPAEMAEQEKPILDVYHLKYITAIDAWRTLRNVKDIKQQSENISTSEESTSKFTISDIEYDNEFIINNVTVGIDEANNTLILFGLSNKIDEVKSIIKEIDKPAKSILIDALILEVGVNAGEKLGIDWNISATASGAKRPVTFPFSANSHELSKYYPYVTPNDSGKTPSGFPAWGSSLPFAGNPYGFPLAGTDDFAFGTLDFSKLTSALHFLKSRSSTRLISHPRVVTLSGKLAKIQIGENVPVPQFSVDDNTGNIVVNGFDYKDTGVVLYVKPVVVGDGEIRLQVHPQVSSQDSASGITTTSGIKVPVFNTRQTDVEVNLKDGQTLAIGGLMKNNTDTTVSKVPLLGDIPLIGRLFSYTDKNNGSNSGKTELLIFITVHILGSNRQIPFAQLDRFTRRDLRKAIKNYHINVEGVNLEEIKPKHRAKVLRLERR